MTEQRKKEKEGKEERIKSTDIDHLDDIFSQEGLSSMCYKTKLISPFKEEKEYDQYRCVIKSNDVEIAEVEFTMKDDEDGNIYAYIEHVNNFYPVQIEQKRNKKQKEIYTVGSQIIFKAVLAAKKLGAKYILLLPLDTGSTKLFQYYKSLGFKCTTDLKTGTDFPLKSDKLDFMNWFVNCEFMIGNVSDILKHCCKAIEYK
jgi:hypothetical protein